ncbi:MAG TPA: hypothetical protein VGF46_03265 [Gaiellales bacterium]|jgi:hypothetical protein
MPLPTLFRVLEKISFFSSAAFACLLFFWLAPGFAPETAVFGWVHGFTWIGLALLAAYAQRRGVLPFWLAFLVVVIGGVGPFAGSLGFVYETRRRRRLATA